MIKEEVAAQKPYAQWLSENLMSLEEWTEEASKQGITVPQYNLHVRLCVFCCWYACECVCLVWFRKVRMQMVVSFGRPTD